MNQTLDVDQAIAEADTEFPALFQLFGGYFHEDWLDEHGQPSAALQAFRREAPADAVRDAVSELDLILGAGLDDAALARLLDLGFACNYVPERDGLTSTAWLTQVRDALLTPSR